MKVKSSFNLGKIFGIPLRLHYTWFFIFILITASLIAYLPISGTYILWQRVVLGIVASLFLFVSITAHELAHSLIAVRNDIPVKGITLFVFGGVSQITKEASRPRTEVLMAIVGPLASILIASIFLGAYLLLREVNELLATITQWLAFINALMAMFNLIPGFPLDGGRVLRSIVWLSTGNYMRATHIATLSGRVVGYIFIAGGIIFMFVTREWIGGLWLAFVGWFLETAASISYRQASFHEAVRGSKVRNIMSDDCPIVSRELSIERLVQDYILRTMHRCFIVGKDDNLEGIVTLQNVKKASREHWSATSVEDIMIPSHKLTIARPNQDALALIELMDENNINEVPVVEGEKIIGMVTRDSLNHRLRIQAELKT
jgi:Zn-dependent protease/predicted transcriptional regulator